MVRTASCLLMLVLAVAVAGGFAMDVRGAQQSALADRVAEVDALLAAGRAQPALDLLAVLLAEHGEDLIYGWQLRDRRGLALLLAGRPAEALPLLEEAVGRRLLEATAHRNLADCLRQLGRRGRALAEYAQAVELAPRNPELRLEHAQYLAEFRMWRQAEQEFLVASSLGAGPDADRGLAVALLRQQRPAEAVAPLRRLHALDGTAASRRDLTAALQAAGRDSELVALLAPVARDSLSAGELLAMVQSEGIRGGDPTVSRSLAAGLDGDPGPLPVRSRAGFWGRVALNLIAAEDWEHALAAADRAVALAPDDLVHRNNRVVILRRLGRFAEADREWADIKRREKP